MSRIFLYLTLIVLLAGCGQRQEQSGKGAPADTSASAAQAPGAAATAVPASRGPGFRDKEHLEAHFAHHAAEFGKITLEEYVTRAQRLRDAPAGGPILEIQRGNGDVARFDRGTGEFGVFTPDGTIRTFFKPSDGEAYFRRQARRHQERKEARDE